MNALKERTRFYSMFFQPNSSLNILQYLDNSTADEIVIVDMNNDVFNHLYHASGKYFAPEISGLSYKRLYKYSHDHIVHPDDLKAYEDLMDPDNCLAKLESSPMRNFRFGHFRYKLQNGSYRWVEQCLITGKEYGLKEGVWKFYVFDIHHLKTREIGNITGDELDINRDNLTNLLNEHAFTQKADMVVRENRQIKWCVLAIDIEHFKLFDDWFGRETGNNLLGQIGAVLRKNEENWNSVSGYLGQDDFAVLLPFNMSLVGQLYEAIRNIILSFDLSFGFMPAIGVGVVEDFLTVEDVLDRASIASNKAKHDIRQRIYVYDSEMHAQLESDYKTLYDFIKALKNKEITFYVQPQVRISTHKIVGGEALARWIKPDGKIIPPGVFIPVLEQFGFVADMDQYLWEEVCIWLKGLIDKGFKPIPISLNVSRVDIFTFDVPNKFKELVEKYDLPKNYLKIEITESAYTQEEIVSSVINRLHEMGFIVLMDDFGSGYSSLNMLNSTKMDAIKLDARFLNHSDDETHEKTIHILESIINMAKIIGVPMIVEGVETKEQSRFLESLGVRYAQGFYFHRPMPIKDFEKLICYEHDVDRRGFVVKVNEQFRLREFLDKNIYSDTMLNNIIGAVAFYSWHDESVDIVRYNQQFYRVVHVPDFQEKIVNIQNVLHPDDKPRIYKLLKDAMEDRLNGSTGVLRFYTIDGLLTTYIMKFYYIGEKEDGYRFYGSANNVTGYADLQQKMRLITKYSSDSFIFIKRAKNTITYTVASHGLSKRLGLSTEQLEKEMNDGSFAKRIVGKKSVNDAMECREKIMNREKNSFCYISQVKNTKGEVLSLEFRHDYVHDETNNVDYIVTIREAIKE